MNIIRNVYCLCCQEYHPLKCPPMIDVGQTYVYCDRCHSNCSHAFSEGKTTYYHNIRILSVTGKKVKQE